MIIDLKNLDIGTRERGDQEIYDKTHQKDVHLAYLNIDKEAERVARKHASEWIQSCLWMECYSTPVDTPVLDSSGVDSSRH
jgi:hypothetical protein